MRNQVWVWAYEDFGGGRGDETLVTGTSGYGTREEAREAGAARLASAVGCPVFWERVLEDQEQEDLWATTEPRDGESLGHLRVWRVGF